jgi:hypothetical protein
MAASKKATHDYKCQLCDFSTPLRIYLNRHQKTVHLKAKNCTQCRKRFGRDFELARHVKNVHSKIKDFPCNHVDCDKAFGSRYKLQFHINTGHNQIKRFYCDVYWLPLFEYIYFLNYFFAECTVFNPGFLKPLRPQVEFCLDLHDWENP